MACSVDLISIHYQDVKAKNKYIKYCYFLAVISYKPFVCVCVFIVCITNYLFILFWLEIMMLVLQTHTVALPLHQWMMLDTLSLSINLFFSALVSSCSFCILESSTGLESRPLTNLPVGRHTYQLARKEIFSVCREPDTIEDPLSVWALAL